MRPSGLLSVLVDFRAMGSPVLVPTTRSTDAESLQPRSQTFEIPFSFKSAVFECDEAVLKTSTAYMCAFWSMYEDLGGDEMSWWRSFDVEGSFGGSPEGMFAGFMFSSVNKLGLCMSWYSLSCDVHYKYVGLSMVCSRTLND
jgi:hypothetical protein